MKDKQKEAIQKVYDFLDEALGQLSSISIKLNGKDIEIAVDGELDFTVCIKKVCIFDEDESEYKEIKLS